MNPLTNVKNVKKLSEQELKGSFKTSWHDQYKDSAWIFVGGLSFDLTEGDVLCVFSQCGEIVNINLVRDKGTGKSKGFCFICYEDQRSTTLAVDNFNGIKLLNRTIRVDHVSDYKAPKDSEKLDDDTRQLHSEGCAPGSKYGSMPQLPRSSNGGLTQVLPVSQHVNAPPVILPPLEDLITQKSGDKRSKKLKEKEVKRNKDNIKSIFKKKKRSSSSSGDTDISDSDSTSKRKRKGHPNKEHKKKENLANSDSENSDNAQKVGKEKKSYRNVSSCSGSESEGKHKLHMSVERNREPGYIYSRREEGNRLESSLQEENKLKSNSTIKERSRGRDDDRNYSSKKKTDGDRGVNSSRRDDRHQKKNERRLHCNRSFDNARSDLRGTELRGDRDCRDRSERHWKEKDHKYHERDLHGYRKEH